MSNTVLPDTPSGYRPKPRPGERTGSPARSASARRGLAGLVTLAVAFTGAAGALGIRTWQVGSGLGAALFPVEDIVELATVAAGTLVAGWVGLHAFLALACVVAGRWGPRWAAGEQAVAQHAPTFVRRLARVAAGAGVGLALTVPTAMASDLASATDPSGDGGAAVVLDLGWQPTERLAADRTDARAADRSASSNQRPRPERLSLVNRGQHTGTGREPVVVVEPGDTLWAIAAGRLAAEQTGTPVADAEIAAAVTRWHHANRQVLGVDPDLIRPGMVLRQP
ncbi:LysM domain-containing protein [Promicromonospora sp. NPDC023805]|uniref:LysM peptidoglycan-binding domain-containing protein n=1 Tax=Promicromonospora sp. NPDC023805 TaxID=3154696 RepID=UPI0033E84609